MTQKDIAVYDIQNIVVQKYFGGWILPSTVTSIQFLKQGDSFKPLTTVKSFEYNADLQIKKETTDTRYIATIVNEEITEYVLNNPNGEIITANYQYPRELTPPITWPFPKGLPISKEVTNGATKILGQYFEYDNSGNIMKTYRYNKGSGTHSGGASYVPRNYELEASYLNEYGKPTQILGHGGVPTSYIWGYNLQFPVAKIMNLPYGSIAQARKTNIKNISETIPYNEVAMINALDALRSAYPQAQITTYTYKPLIGVSTITDPKGYRITYEYDNFGRLKYVKDMEGNVLSKNEYHYKNN